MSLKEHSTHEEIKELVRIATGQGPAIPNNANLINCAHYITNGHWTATSIRFFSFPAENPVYVFLTEESDLQFPFLFIRPPPEGNDPSLLSTALPLLLATLAVHINRYGRFLLETDDDTRKLVLKILKSSGKYKIDQEEKWDTILIFFMDDDQCMELIETRLDLPDGYIYSNANLEDDLMTIHATWPFGSIIDIGVSRERLKQLPHSCVKTSAGELAGWELSHPFGYVSHLHVLTEHRERGLGPLTELKLLQDYAISGMRPIKFIDGRNEKVNKGTSRSPLWTQWKHSDGRPVQWTFTVLTPTA